MAPTSTPWVGSSRRKTDGSVDSHFPNRIFCWLPPLKVASGSSTPVAGRTDNRSNHSFVRAFSALRRTIPPLQKGFRFGSVRFSRALIVMTDPLIFRSGETYATPRPMATSGRDAGSGSPASFTSPASRGRRPKHAPSTVSRPDPASPAIPTISPRSAVRETPASAPAAEIRDLEHGLVFAGRRTGGLLLPGLRLLGEQLFAGEQMDDRSRGRSRRPGPPRPPCRRGTRRPCWRRGRPPRGGGSRTARRRRGPPAS